MFKIGNIDIKNQVVMAPMAGISNPSYMKILEEFGVSLAFTELISSEAIIRDNKKTFEMLNGINDLNIPVGIQIFGSNSDTMAKAAKILVDKYNVKIIDINMGCPVPKVAVRSEAGSGLLRNPDKVQEIVKKVVENVDVPVTVKIRSGWDFNSINAVEIAKIIESAGASAITVHPRTRAQGYSGKADWNIIKKVKENVSIPVIGNGDIKSCLDAKKMIDETGCDAIMIGRGLLGNPWLVKDCVDYFNNNKIPNNITEEQKIDMILYHLKMLVKYKNDRLAILEMRTNASFYLKGLKDTKELKQAIFKTNTVEDFEKLIKDYKKEKNYE